MAYINDIQQAILQLEGGAFQKLFDRYLMKKYKFKNIQSLGVQVGTNKPTKGVPDSYVVTDEGNYILINYGTVAKNQEEKIRKDILACFDDSKLQLPKEKIEKIICGHTLSNMHIEAYDRIRNLIDGEKIELISIEKLSHDLADEYPHIAKEELGISMDSGQFFDIEDFVEVSDASGINAPISFDFYFRESEMTELVQSIHMNKVTIMTGPSGIGKTRLALEFCRKLEREGFKIYCIRSNGNLLYEDIKRYVSDPEKYLLFFDDANMISSLDNALDTLFNLLNKYEIKVLITVRDYAQKKVIEVAEKYPTYSTHSIERFKNNEIKEILEKNLNILNSWYLDQITDIAKGNIRLAILAGKISIDKGYAELKNAEDIFKNYYGRIFEEARLSKEDILMLFIITAAGPVRNGMNPFYENLKKKYGDTIPQTDTIEKLHELELIDWFKSEITKISDQSFGNYILYYVLYEKKWVKIEDFISIGFPQNRKKVGYVLDTLKNIFDSKELSKYLNDSILSAWEKCPQDQEAIYLHAFCLVNPNKTLSILLNKIRHEKDINFDLRNYDIDSKKNFSRINNDIIEILGNFKYMDSFEEAVDLLLLYFSKRPDLFMNFYFVICEKFLFDEYSINLDYQHEMVLLNKLWESTETGSNYNNSLLYLHIVENALKTNRSFTRTSRNDNSIKFITFNLPFNDTIRQLRKTIIEHLAILRKKEEYRDRVNKILLSDQFHLYENENIEMYLKTDFDTIFEVVIDKNDPDFFDALIIGHYETIVNNIGGEIDDRYLVALRNPKYKIYKLLSVDSEYAYTKKEENEEHKKLISKEIGSYNVDDYQKMFEVCIFLETVIPLKDHWAIRSSLDYVFKILEDNSDLYIQVIEAYFLVNAPFNSCSLYHQIDYLLAHIGYERTLSLVNRIEFDKKDICQTAIWESLPNDKINEKARNDLKNFLLRILDQENSTIPSVMAIHRYFKEDHEFENILIEKMNTCPKLLFNFLGAAHDDEEVKVILFFFRNKIETLSDLYIKLHDQIDYMDYSGKLFIGIFKQYPLIWNKYIDWVIKHLDKKSNKIIDSIWIDEDWENCINYAYKTVIEDRECFFIEEPAKFLFLSSENELIVERKKKWLQNYLQKNYMDMNRINKLFSIISTVLSEWKVEFIFQFLKLNKSFEDFKQLSFFPLPQFVVGSEIPRILEKISFLKMLLNNLKGIEYIEHINYLEEMLRELEKFKKETEMKEYLESSDFI